MPRVLAVLFFLLCATPAAAQPIATVTTNAPIYIAPRETQTPLRIAAVGTRLRVISEEGDWIQVEFQDPQYGRRVGYIERKFVGISDETVEPMDLSVPPAGLPPPPTSTVQPRPAMPVPRSAATYPKTETSLGWAFLHVAEETLESPNSTLGWNVSFAGNLTPWLGIVADVTGNYKTELLNFEGFDGNIHSFLGGPRFSLRMSPLVVPFAEFLVGATHTYVSLEDVLDQRTTDFTLQPGGGVDIGNETIAARLSFAWRRVFYEGEATNNYRFVAGVVFRR